MGVEEKRWGLAGVLALAFALVACSEAGDDEGAARCVADQWWDDFGERCVDKLPERSGPNSSWTPGTVAFVERTEAWFGGLPVEGIRLSVADVDGDGWPDLFVRRGSAQGDDFRTEGERHTWLLRNVEGKRFEDVTEASGIVARRDGAPGLGRPVDVAVFADIDNDGSMDAYLAYTTVDGERAPAGELMLNDGSGKFSHGPEGFAGRFATAQVRVGAAVFSDFDRDGWVDLFVGLGSGKDGALVSDRLYRNLGDGSFADRSADAGLSTLPWDSLENLNRGLAHSNAWGAIACDLDGDGARELLVSSYGRAPNHLWRGEVGGTFRNESVASGYAFDHRQDWSDHEGARCHCKLFPRDEGCAGVPQPRTRCESEADIFRWNHARDREPFRLGGNSATTVCADLDGDGLLDLVTSEIVHWDVGTSSDPSEILYNEGGEPLRFRRPGPEKTGFAKERDLPVWDDGDMTVAVFDFDNDGRPDIYLGSADYPGTRGHLYWQRPDGTFQEVPVSEGIDHRSSHGLAIADFDGDGDLDLVVGHSRNRCSGGEHCYETARLRFFENVLGDRGNWIQLDLVGGEGSNQAAIGARVRVETDARLQVQEVDGGHGHYGIQHDRVLHFGLGEDTRPRVSIRWPDAAGSEQRFTLQAGYRYRIEQGKAPAAILGD